MTGIIDYDAGNLRSVAKALEALGETPVISRDPEQLMEADRVILPGVGSFGDAMEKLNQYGLVSVIKEIADSKKPFWESAWDFSFCLRAVKKVPEYRDLGFFQEKFSGYQTVKV